LSNEQYRISGSVEVVSAEVTDPMLIQARIQQWKDISPLAKEQFYSSKIPGALVSETIPEKSMPESMAESSSSKIPKTSPDSSQSAVATSTSSMRPNNIDDKYPPDTFVLLLLWPSEVKYVRLTDRYGQLDQLDETNATWKSLRVNP